MPELPEVQTVVTDLQVLFSEMQPILTDLLINDAKVWVGDSLLPSDYHQKALLAVRRRGKYIVYDFGDRYICQHLRMTGTVLGQGSPKLAELDLLPSNKKLRAKFSFSGVGEQLFFYDMRRFGTLEPTEDLVGFIESKKLAPELIGDNLSLPDRNHAREFFVNKAGRSGKAIKAILLDQTVINGPGNIYADEALHISQIHPQKYGSQLAERQLVSIFDNACAVMEQAIAKRGTSASDYLDVNGNPGIYKKYLKVYRRTGESCKTCGEGVIHRAKVGGRSSHYCPNCQPYDSIT